MNEAKKYVVGALGAGQPMEESGALAKLQARMRGKAARSEGGRRHKAVAAKQFAHGKIGLTVGAADGYDASERATTYGDGLEASPLSNLGGDLIQQKIRPELKLAATPARKSMARGAGSGRRKSQAGRRASSAAGPPKGGRKSRLSKVQMRRAGMAIDKSLDDLITGMNNRAKRRGTTRTPLALQWALSASRRGMTFIDARPDVDRRVVGVARRDDVEDAAVADDARRAVLHLGRTREIQRRFNLSVPRARVPKKHPRFETVPRDDRSSKNQPKRVENDRDMRL